MKRPEQSLHLQVARYLSVALRHPTWWSSIEHATKLGPVAGAMRKRRGVKPGLPDILVMHPRAPFNTVVLGIELKAKGNYASPDQKRLATDFENAGAGYRIAWTLEDVANHLQSFGIPLHAKLS